MARDDRFYWSDSDSVQWGPDPDQRFGYLVVGVTTRTGRRWFQARSGLGCYFTRKISNAEVFDTKAKAEQAMSLARRDSDRGRGGQSFHVERHPIDTAGRACGPRQTVAPSNTVPPDPEP